MWANNSKRNPWRKMLFGRTINDRPGMTWVDEEDLGGINYLSMPRYLQNGWYAACPTADILFQEMLKR